MRKWSNSIIQEQNYWYATGDNLIGCPLFSFALFRYFRRNRHIYLSQRKVLSMFIPFVFRVVIHRKYTEMLSLRWRFEMLVLRSYGISKQHYTLSPIPNHHLFLYLTTLCLSNFTSPLISLPYLLQPPHNLTSSYKDSSPSQFHCFCTLIAMLLYPNKIEFRW